MQIGAGRARCVVLLIEDDVDLYEAYRELLEAEGHVCVATASAREGLALMEVRHFDVVLLDWRLREMSGEEFLRAREASDVHRQVPVFVITAARLTPSAVSGFSRTRLMPKPHSVTDLLEALDECCQGRSAEAKTAG